MANGACNKLSFDTRSVMGLLTDYYMGVLEIASYRLIEIMQVESMVTMDGGGPGKEEWRAAVRDSIKVVHRNLASDIIEFGVGAPETSNVREYIMQMLVTYGAGSGAGGTPIHTKPGQIVFDGNLNLK